jgi:hypothetical protein
MTKESLKLLTFRRKLAIGEGHETNAQVYGNFKLFIKNLVLRWLRSVVPTEDVLNNCKININYLDLKE